MVEDLLSMGGMTRPVVCEDTGVKRGEAGAVNGGKGKAEEGGWKREGR